MAGISMLRRRGPHGVDQPNAFVPVRGVPMTVVDEESEPVAALA